MRFFQPEEVIVVRGSEQSPIFANLRKALPHVPFSFVDDFSMNDKSSPRSFGAAKKRVLKEISGQQGASLLQLFRHKFCQQLPHGLQLLLLAGILSAESG